MRIIPSSCFAHDEPVEYIHVNDSPILHGGYEDEFFVRDAPRVRWAVAYRAARLACRGERRAHLALEPTYEPDCKSCNAGNRVAGAVMHALGLHDHRHPTCTVAAILTGGAIEALAGTTWRAKPLSPDRLDFEAWAAWRVRQAELQQKAAA